MPFTTTGNECEVGDFLRSAVAEVAGKFRDVIAVELGCREGHSSIYIAKAIQAECRGRGLLYCVDWYLGSAGTPEKRDDPDLVQLSNFVANVYAEKLADVVTLVVCRTEDAARLFGDGSVHLVWIDGGHSYSQIRADVEAWWPKVAAGGIISGHDYDVWHHGVCKYVTERFGIGALSPPRNWCARKP